MIGVFVLTLVAALFVFVFWLARSDIEQQAERYVIYFQESVSGLGVGAAVTYRGLKVGSVADMGIDAQDPSRIVVHVDIDSSVRIRRGDIASLRIQGITGVAFIEIRGAEPDDPPLVADAGQEFPVIPSGPSEIAKLISGAPQLIDNANVLVQRVSELFKEENRLLIDQTLADLSALAASLASRRTHMERVIDALDDSRDDIRSTFASLRNTAGKLNEALDRLNATLTRADHIVAADLPGLLKDIENTTESLDSLLVDMRSVVEENREPLRAFLAEGLTEIMRFVQEARLLTAGLSRVLDRFEAEGARFLLRDEESGFAPPR